MATKDPATPRRDTRTQWTLKGISRETRTAVTKAAARDNMKINEWVDAKLWEAATATLQQRREVATADDNAAIRQQLEQLTEKVERLAAERQGGAIRQLMSRVLGLSNRG
jgi:hypothetical protein